MRLCREPSRHKRADILSSLTLQTTAASEQTFTFIKVMIVMALMTILIVSGFSAILSMKVWSNRLAQYTAAMAVVEAKLEDLRAAKYNPPNAPFVYYTTNQTSSGSIDLNEVGAKFLITGTVVSRIEQVANGHLITVTGTFPALRQPISVTLQTVVNKYSGGQQ